MKYLRLFESALDEEDKQTIKEICYDITDDGFFVGISSIDLNVPYYKNGWGSRLNMDSGEAHYIYINAPVDRRSVEWSSTPSTSLMLFSEIKDVVNRLKLFLGDRMTKTFVYRPGKTNDWFHRYDIGPDINSYDFNYINHPDLDMESFMIFLK